MAKFRTLEFCGIEFLLIITDARVSRVTKYLKQFFSFWDLHEVLCMYVHVRVRMCMYVASLNGDF